MLGTYALWDLPVDLPLLGAAFCGTALIYGVDRFLVASPEDDVNRPDRGRWGRQFHGWVRLEGSVLLIGLLVMVPLLHEQTLVVGALLGGVGLSHVAPLLPGGRRLKETRALKPILIAATWAGGSVLLPVLEAGAGEAVPVFLFTAYRVAFILPNVLLADWADRSGDAAMGLPTWTERWSFRQLQLGSTLLVGLAIGGALVAVTAFGAPCLLLLDAAGLVAMALAVWTLRPGRSPVHALLMDLLVAWPAVGWGVHWLLP
jgi:4-hydroxybenzoate polyprenyltransferase